MKIFLGLVLFIFGLSVGILASYYYFSGDIETSPLTQLVEKPKETPLVRYQIEKLAQKTIAPSTLNYNEPLKNYDKYASYIYNMNFDPTFDRGNQKKITGLINIPKSERKLPLVLLIRGYVDQTIYSTGVGTFRAGEYFANNGFITVAPDFLGYAGSDTESGNIFESRFQTYTTILATISSLHSIEVWDKKYIFIWAHSNGGQIALTTLSITQKNYPTVLWAPVTKPFPYSVLFYTDESEDGGKFIRTELAKFENLYDVSKYSFTNYLEKITAPMIVHQGTADDAIPVEWSRDFVNRINKTNKDVSLIIHPGADHNMRPAWDEAIEKDLNFFQKYLTE